MEPERATSKKAAFHFCFLLFAASNVVNEKSLKDDVDMET
jgi:hypothetical protein